MAERTIAAVLKTAEVQASGGSNPSPSANSCGTRARPGVGMRFAEWSFMRHPPYRSRTASGTVIGVRGLLILVMALLGVVSLLPPLA